MTEKDLSLMTVKELDILEKTTTDRLIEVQDTKEKKLQEECKYSLGDFAETKNGSIVSLAKFGTGNDSEEYRIAWFVCKGGHGLSGVPADEVGSMYLTKLNGTIERKEVTEGDKATEARNAAMETMEIVKKLTIK
ncbi:MAG TPA: hypothetical protein ENG14_04315 [Thermodesulforhabdus norvegica]|uniref:Uncharacterized protein n=1 Tax=Thermodesulforhabdus norvegica TaxID=39841 RepID=A0A7C1AYE6_9BACT|nr:hypothetical protein [Thermodesulforhabdus norvegica]